MWTAAALTIALAFALASSTEAKYTENLYARQVEDGRVTFEFEFSETSASNSLAEVADAFGVSSLSLSFTQGTTCHPARITKGECRPPGVVLYAWLRNNHGSGKQSVDSRWTGLTNALAGVFCASLNFITPKVTAEPRLVFNGTLEDTANHSLRFASLPREITCTENLTPWTKLLPCSTKAGIATLLNAYSLYDADYHSMSVDLIRKCGDNDGPCHVNIVQRLVTVLDPVRKGYLRNMDWSLKFLFDRELLDVCPLVTGESNLIISLPNKVKSNVQFEGPVKPRHAADSGLYTFPLVLGQKLDFNVKYADSRPNRAPSAMPKPPIEIYRHLTGYGRERGGISVRLVNNDAISHNITLLEVLPWFLKLYLHTLRSHTFPLHADTNQSFNNDSRGPSIYYQAAIPRTRPNVMELSTELPPASETFYSMDFDRAFLKYTEHPPDANRGFDTGPAVVSVDGGKYRLFSGVLLVALPTPDFSMPYNVITMTCTVVALYFGTVFNLLVKKLEGLPEEQMKKKWWMFWIREKTLKKV